MEKTVNWHLNNFIGGRFVETNPGFGFASYTALNRNPCTGYTLCMVPISMNSIVNRATEIAHEAWQSWKKVSRVKRSDLFYGLCKLVERDQSKIAEIISLETGKSLNESNAEVVESLHMCQWVAGCGRQPYGEWMASEIAEKDAFVTRKPKGVVAVISPWNFPLAIGSFWTTGPALLEGNTVVHKPSEMTPYTAQYVAGLYQEAGFPDGVYNLVHGDGSTGKDLVNANYVRSILFTGSAAVGSKIRRVCADRYDRICSVETGSKSATILFEDGDQNLALEAMIASAFKLTGQRCVSSGRMLIQRSVYDQFVRKFVARASVITVGDPFNDPAPYCGPLISYEQREKVKGYNEITKTYCKIYLEGKSLDKGFFLTPHVYGTEWSDASFLHEEVFGPHVALIPFNDVQDAIRIYNDTEYGLALGVITSDYRKMRLMREECNAGMIYFNAGSVAAESHFPFGGVGKSGNGYKTAAGTYRAVTDEMAVTINYDDKITWAQGMK